MASVEIVEADGVTLFSGDVKSLDGFSLIVRFNQFDISFSDMVPSSTIGGPESSQTPPDGFLNQSQEPTHLARSGQPIARGSGSQAINANAETQIVTAGIPDPMPAESARIRESSVIRPLTQYEALYLLLNPQALTRSDTIDTREGIRRYPIRLLSVPHSLHYLYSGVKCH